MFSMGKDFWNYIIELDRLSYQNTKKSISQKLLFQQVKIFKAFSKEYDLIHSHIYQKIVSHYCEGRSNAFLKFKKKSNKPKKIGIT
jgi:hypothetical protein